MEHPGISRNIPEHDRINKNFKKYSRGGLGGSGHSVAEIIYTLIKLISIPFFVLVILLCFVLFLCYFSFLWIFFIYAFLQIFILLSMFRDVTECSMFLVLSTAIQKYIFVDNSPPTFDVFEI